MADDKVMISFRISKDRKRQLEYLAEKEELSITQYLDTTILNRIQSVLFWEGYDESWKKAAIKAGIDPNIARAISTNNPNQNYDFLDGALYEKLQNEHSKTVESYVNKRYKEFGLEKMHLEKIKDGRLFAQNKGAKEARAEIIPEK